MTDDKKDAEWVPFFYESNLFFDWINVPEDWNRLRDANPGKADAHFLAAKEATYQGTRPIEERKKHPKWGYRIECDGRPLSEFFQENQMTPPPRTGAPE